MFSPRPPLQPFSSMLSSTPLPTFLSAGLQPALLPQPPSAKARVLGWIAVLAAALLAGGCASRSNDIAAEPSSPAEFLSWDCARIDDELDLVQQRAADRAYAVDERVGNNIIALGVGVTVFWPAMLAMRTHGAEAEDLARLKGRYEALRQASARQGCPPASDELPATRAAALPLAVGEKLVYEDRSPLRGPGAEWVLQLTALRRGETEYRRLQPLLATAGSAAAPAQAPLWRQDRVGNITASPAGTLLWPHLLRGELVLGAVTAGDILVSGDPQARARMRGQVVAVGPQLVAGRRFDAAVVELFGDAQRGDASTRVEGVIVVDRASGVLLRLDLRSGQAPFSLLRRLVRVEAAPG